MKPDEYWCENPDNLRLLISMLEDKIKQSSGRARHGYKQTLKK